MATKNKTWGVGNVALFGAIIMSKGYYGEEKEMLKDCMYQALVRKKSKPLFEEDVFYKKNHNKHPEWFC